MSKENVETEVVETNTAGEILEIVENDLIPILSKSYTFEGEVYTKIDLKGLEDITCADMIKVNKLMQRTGDINVLQEMSVEYAMRICSIASGLPYEFFMQLKPADVMKLKNKVSGFLFQEA